MSAAPSEKTCRFCKFWKSDKDFSKFGFGTCALGDKWQFWPRSHTCARWRIATDEQMQKRETYFRLVGAGA